MNKFKMNDLVEISGYVAEITKIEDEKFTVYYDGQSERLFASEVKPIKIRDKYDFNIKLKIPLMAKYVGPHDTAPVLKYYHYLEYPYICDIIKKTSLVSFTNYSIGWQKMNRQVVCIIATFEIKNEFKCTFHSVFSFVHKTILIQ